MKTLINLIISRIKLLYNLSKLKKTKKIIFNAEEPAYQHFLKYGIYKNYDTEEFSILENYKNKFRPNINKKIALENLINVRNLLNKFDIKYAVFYGTLLGFHREKDFISYTTDTDLVIFNFKKVLQCLCTDEFKRLGFKIGRIHFGFLISIYKENEFIDFYYLKPKNILTKNIKMGLKNKILDNFDHKFHKLHETDAEFFKNFSIIEVLNEKFVTIDKIESYLFKQYGSDWKIPKSKSFNLKRN